MTRERLSRRLEEWAAENMRRAVQVRTADIFFTGGELHQLVNKQLELSRLTSDLAAGVLVGQVELKEEYLDVHGGERQLPLGFRATPASNGAAPAPPPPEPAAERQSGAAMIPSDIPVPAQPEPEPAPAPEIPAGNIPKSERARCPDCGGWLDTPFKARKPGQKYGCHLSPEGKVRRMRTSPEEIRRKREHPPELVAMPGKPDVASIGRSVIDQWLKTATRAHVTRANLTAVDRAIHDDLRRFGLNEPAAAAAQADYAGTPDDALDGPHVAGYMPHHPWYYKLGGKPLDVDEIKPIIRDDTAALLESLHRLPKDKKRRAAKLTALLGAAGRELESFRQAYRDCVAGYPDGRSDLERHNDQDAEDSGSANSYQVALSLTHNHVCSALSDKIVLERLLAECGAPVAPANSAALITKPPRKRRACAAAKPEPSDQADWPSIGIRDLELPLHVELTFADQSIRTAGELAQWLKDAEADKSFGIATWPEPRRGRVIDMIRDRLDRIRQPTPAEAPAPVHHFAVLSGPQGGPFENVCAVKAACMADAIAVAKQRIGWQVHNFPEGLRIDGPDMATMRIAGQPDGRAPMGRPGQWIPPAPEPRQGESIRGLGKHLVPPECPPGTPRSYELIYHGDGVNVCHLMIKAVRKEDAERFAQDWLAVHRANLARWKFEVRPVNDAKAERTVQRKARRDRAVAAALAGDDREAMRRVESGPATADPGGDDDE